MTKLPRTKKRASSRAHTECPYCKKKLHGQKGLERHIEEVHKNG